MSKMKNGKNGLKGAWVVQKHRTALEGTGFESCAECAGCPGKLHENGLMKCSRTAPGAPFCITVQPAKACDGTRPSMLVDLEAARPRTRADFDQDPTYAVCSMM